MHSRMLATLATAGLTVALAPFGVVAALALREPARLLAPLVPRPARLGRTVLLLLAIVGLGLVAGLFALSRADWRVLDLGPIEAAALALPLGIGHGWFWYRTERGRLLQPRLPVMGIRVGATPVVLILVLLAALTPESSPTFQAIEEKSLGLRFVLAVTRKLSDSDGDGYSARFGGGDCDDHRADTTPAPRTCRATASIRTARAATPWPSPPLPLPPPRGRRRPRRRPRPPSGGPARPSRATSSSSASTR